MVIHNEDVVKIVVEIPEGHQHIRTTITFKDGREMMFQEATIANIVRGYVQIKTHPVTKTVVMTGRIAQGCKEGYAAWQLLEEL